MISSSSIALTNRTVIALVALWLAGCEDRSVGKADRSSDPTQSPGARLVDHEQIGRVDDERIKRAAINEPGSWLTYGQTYKEQRFSTLTQIGRDGLQELGVAWFKAIGDGRDKMQSTPLIVDGVMYVTNGWSVIYALDAGTGEEIWTYDPKTDREYIKYACCGGAANRGVAVYKGRVYVATFDGRLIAVDAATGEEVWDIDTYHPSALGRFNITGAPRAAAGKVFIGQGSSESGHRRGYVTAYDADSGEVVWRFYLVPGDPSKPFEHPEMELAAKTWGGEWWKYGGGGTAWSSLVYDEELGSLYIGVGNGAPWPRQIRSPGGGDDLFLTAIVSVDVESGRMNWYYQTVPGDNWDYSSAMPIALGDMTVDGVERKVLLQAPKNGFFYVIDRTDGELLRAHPYTEGITWATHVDMETGRPVENPDVVYETDPQWILPANAGAHNWEPMSFDEASGIMYFYYHDYANFYSLDETFVATGKYEINEIGLSLGLGLGPYRSALEAKAPPRPETRGFLIAFDPLSGESRWKLELPTGFNGGVLATVTGLLFQGDGKGQLSAYNTDSGELLWRFDAYGSFSAAPVTYMIDGTQYLAAIAGSGAEYDSPGKLIVFKLGGAQTLPQPPLRSTEIPQPPTLTASAETVDRGNALYHQICANCHRGLGVPMVIAAAAPDLRMMTLDTHKEFSEIVHDGTKQELGMPGFGDSLDEESLSAIRAFIISRAIEEREARLQRQSSDP